MNCHEQESNQTLLDYSRIIHILGMPHLYLYGVGDETNLIRPVDRSCEFIANTVHEHTVQSTISSDFDENHDAFDSDEVPFHLKDWKVLDLVTERPRAPRQNEFLYLLLENPLYINYASWLDKNQGFFKIHEPERVASLWKRVKNRQTHGIMDYDTFARGIRHYYKSGMMMKTNRKYTFRFRR